MITLRNWNEGIKVTCDPGIPGQRKFSVQAKDVIEAMAAVRHWFTGHTGIVPHCPICRLIEKEKQRNESIKS